MSDKAEDIAVALFSELLIADIVQALGEPKLRTVLPILRELRTRLELGDPG